MCLSIGGVGTLHDLEIAGRLKFQGAGSRHRRIAVDCHECNSMRVVRLPGRSLVVPRMVLLAGCSFILGATDVFLAVAMPSETPTIHHREVGAVSFGVLS